eukprot:Hpha_TRINITY_DN12103_c0_g2::TRINITY_DN12103_c0_g2_i2::g.81772::m.81772
MSLVSHTHSGVGTVVCAMMPLTKARPFASLAGRSRKDVCGGCGYRMTAFRNEMSQGQSVSVTFDDRPAAYVVVVVVPKAVCLNSMDPTECAATHSIPGLASTCADVDGTCQDMWCDKRFE